MWWEQHFANVYPQCVGGTWEKPLLRGLPGRPKLCLHGWGESGNRMCYLSPGQAPRITVPLSTSLPTSRYHLHPIRLNCTLYGLQNAFKVILIGNIFEFFERFVWCVLIISPILLQISPSCLPTQLCVLSPHQGQFVFPKCSWMCGGWLTYQGSLRENWPFISQQLTIAR